MEKYNKLSDDELVYICNLMTREKYDYWLNYFDEKLQAFYKYPSMTFDPNLEHRIAVMMYIYIQRFAISDISLPFPEDLTGE